MRNIAYLILYYNFHVSCPSNDRNKEGKVTRETEHDAHDILDYQLKAEWQKDKTHSYCQPTSNNKQASQIQIQFSICCSCFPLISTDFLLFVVKKKSSNFLWMKQNK